MVRLTVVFVVLIVSVESELADLFSTKDNLVSLRDRLDDRDEDYGRLLDKCRFNTIAKSDEVALCMDGIRVSERIDVAVVFSDLEESTTELDEISIQRACKSLEVLLRSKQIEVNSVVRTKAAIRALGEQEKRKRE
ncbi:MAG: hypothetical protein ACK52S_21375 [Pirellula sp.]|jgi:hypothetical protein